MQILNNQPHTYLSHFSAGLTICDKLSGLLQLDAVLLTYQHKHSPICPTNQKTLNKADTFKTSDLLACWEHTQLSVLWAAKGVEVSFAVHHHAELCTTSHLHQRLAVVGNLEEREEHQHVYYDASERFQLLHNTFYIL